MERLLLACLLTIPTLEAGLARSAEQPYKNQGANAQRGDAYAFTEAVSKSDRATIVKRKIITNAIGMRFALVTKGDFLMGSDETVADIERTFGKQEWLRPEWIASERPQHRVRITRSFYIGAFEVTKGQFSRFVESEGYRTEAQRDGRGAKGWSRDENALRDNPEFCWRSWGVSEEADSPVVNVSWNDAAAFCTWLSKKERRRYRLPTEAEWEYSCRAGTSTYFYNGDNPERLVDIGNVGDGTAKEMLSLPFTLEVKDGHAFTCRVGEFGANAFGLHDMIGNAAEWCSDRYGKDYYEDSPVDDPQGPETGTSRVIRGGGWDSGPVLCRSTDRRNAAPSYRVPVLGFRVVCELDDKHDN